MPYSPEELLYIYGFTNGDDKGKKVEERKKKLKEVDADRRKSLVQDVDAEVLELAEDYFGATGYPKSLSNYRLVWETPGKSVEASYFWILEHLRQDRGFHDILKITDLYSSSEASAFFGNMQGRIANQQNMAQGLLANIGKFVRDTFQMVREIRIIEERLEAYENWMKEKEDGTKETSDSADVVLKSIFTDLAEGGMKNPQSVFGLAQNVQFTILPDLFFQTRVYSEADIDKKIKEMKYNESVKTVLRRKLMQFLSWRKATHDELKHRFRFNVSYLRQHWSIIQTYMSWAKPVLRNIKALSQAPRTDDPDLIHSFDTNLTEIELLAKHSPKGGAYPVVLVTIRFRTRPDMSIRQEYQQGPGHTGRLEMTFRSYAWTQEQIDNYQAMRAQEEFDLLGVLDESIAQTMDYLGEDFEKYLTGKEDKMPKKEEQKASAKKASEKATFKEDAVDMFEPFIAIFGGFAEIFGMFVPRLNFSSGKKKSSGGGGPDFGGAGKTASLNAFLTFNIYKKSRQLLSW